MGTNQNNFTNEEKTLKSSYYNLLSKNLKNRYDNNHYDLFNQNYALFKKDFEKSYINQRILSIPLAQNYISWKSYLLFHLRFLENENGYIWAHSLYEIISSENFPEQIKFQNLFFYQEHQVLSNLKLNINSEFDFEDFGYTNMIREKDYISNVDEPLIEQAPQDPFYIVKSKISNTLMASFISGGSDSLNSSMKKDPNKEYHFNKNKIKEYMDIFRQHLSIKEHPINFVIIQFFNQFIPKIDEVINFYKINYKNKKLSCEEKALDIVTQLQEFMVLVQIIIKIFYSRSISYVYFRDEKDEFLNLVSFIIFNNDKIYKKFFELFELMNKENEEILESKFQFLGDLTPEEIGIKPEFCLNQKTNELIEKLKEEKKNLPNSEKDSDNNDNNDKLTFNINGEEKIINDETDIDTTPIKENKEKEINNDNNKDEIKQSSNTNITNSSRLTVENFKITSDTGKLNIFTNDLFKSTVNFNSNEPYYEAILYIQKIKDFKVPLQKLIVVASLSNVITGCVNKFWKNMENIIKPEMLSIDSDELMTIFIYIIYKCKIPSIFVHADFINYFTTPTTKATMVGYYYITFKGCLDFLLNIKSKNDFIKESI
jgi:hypothetical protein